MPRIIDAELAKMSWWKFCTLILLNNFLYSLPVLITRSRKQQLENVEASNELLLEYFEEYRRLKNKYEPDEGFDRDSDGNFLILSSRTSTKDYGIEPDYTRDTDG